ncbi:hypothetical protein ANO14919_006290 [Xylariales sp. No.14919]|nr:hypothetical protein ANO14919_006290 [Xylariales sp. No.14919]
MRPSLFVAVLAVVASSLPLPQLTDSLTDLPDMLFQTIGGLLGMLLGSHGHRQHYSLPGFFDSTSCIGDCTLACIGNPQACIGCMSSCLTQDIYHANNGTVNRGGEGGQNYDAAQNYDNGEGYDAGEDDVGDQVIGDDYE